MKYFAVLLTIIILLTGCQKHDETTNSSDPTKGQEELEKNEIYYDNGEIKLGVFPQREQIDPNNGSVIFRSNITNEYEISDSIENIEYNFSDALYMDNSIIATDKKGNQLVILNNELEVTNTIGSFGSGNVEFLSPVAIDKDINDNLYILDAGNYRIQVLDSKLNYIKEIRLDFLEDYILIVESIGFIVDNSGEFAYFTETQQGILLCIDLTTGEFYKVEEYTSGKFTKDKEYVYYINTYIYSGDSINMTMTTEEVFLYKICGKDIINKVRLYDGQQSRGITLVDDALYYMNNSQGFMMAYDLEGNYISTPYAGLLKYMDEIVEDGIINEEIYSKYTKGKLYRTAYSMKQGSNDDIIVVYNCIEMREPNKGGAISILRKVKK